MNPQPNERQWSGESNLTCSHGNVGCCRTISSDGPLTLYICGCGFWGRWQDERAHRRVCAMDSTTAEYVPAAQSLRLAQALRVIRDTTLSNDYVVNVATRALAEAGVPDPPPEETL